MCSFCNEKNGGTMSTRYVILKMETYGKYRGLEVTGGGCPQVAECPRKDDPIRSVFFIYYCPICGRNLREGQKC